MPEVEAKLISKGPLDHSVLGLLIVAIGILIMILGWPINVVFLIPHMPSYFPVLLLITTSMACGNYIRIAFSLEGCCDFDPRAHLKGLPLILSPLW